MKILKNMDFIVQPYEFKVHKRSNQLTVLGGILTLLIGIITITYIVTLFVKNIQNQDTIYAGTSGQSAEGSILDQKVVQFVMEVSDTDNNFYGDLTELQEYIQLTGTFINQTRSEGINGFNRTEYSLNVVKCDDVFTQSFSFQASTITNAQLQNMFCLNGTYSTNGQYQDELFQYVKIKVKICKQSATQKCKSIEEITEFIEKGINIDLYLKDSKVKQSLNITSPAEIYPTNIFWRLTSGIGNNEDIYLAPIKVDIKTNSLLDMIFGIKNNKNILNAVSLSRQERRQESVSMNFGVSMCTFYLRVSSESKYYFAIQSDWEPIFLSCLSEATALSLAFMSFIKIFYKIYNKHNTFVKLMNCVYKFNLSQNIQLCMKARSIGKLDNIFGSKIKYSFISFIFYYITQFHTRIFKKQKTNQQDEIEISQMAKKKIESDLDLTNILKKLYEIDCLKLLLFDDDQLMLFNSLCSPIFESSMLNQQDIPNSVKLIQQQTSQNIYDTRGENLPFELKLAQISRFFRAQQLPQNSNQLKKIYQRIENNENQNINMNSNMITFSKINQILYQLVKKDELKNEIEIMLSSPQKQPISDQEDDKLQEFAIQTPKQISIKEQYWLQPKHRNSQTN